MKNNSTLHSEGQDSIINNYLPRVNDDHATVSDSKSGVDSTESGVGSRESGVNDDLALFSAVVKRESSNVNNTSKEPRPNNNDAIRPFASFVFLCRIIIQEFFSGVEFQNQKLVLLASPIRVIRVNPIRVIREKKANHKND